jgi:hypothetical protein
MNFRAGCCPARGGDYDGRGDLYDGIPVNRLPVGQ